MKNLFGDFFKGIKILVTGHTGFIGSWLSIWLNELGANVIGYALPPYTEEDNFVLTNLEKKIRHKIGDIRNFEDIINTFNNYQPEIVFHLAAQPIVRKSYKVPKETYDVNIGGTVNILEAFRQTPSCKLLLNFTSDKCYKNKEKTEGYKETDQLGGYDPYSSSKACSEQVTQAYINSFFGENQSKKPKYVASIRSGNIIGGGDWQEDRLIPDCMKAIKKNQKILIRNPTHVRPWQYVLEPIRGMLMLAKKLWEENSNYVGAWNFGPNPNFVYSTLDVVKLALKYLEKPIYEIQLGNSSIEFHETKLLLLDCSKAESLLHWKPVLNIEEIIKFVFDWYTEEKISYNYDVKQINDYLKIVNTN